jgi:hypothetical protein
MWGVQIMYLVTKYEIVFNEDHIIKMMLETGEYGINGYPISHEAIVDFVKVFSYGEDIKANYEDEYPDHKKLFTIQDPDGETLFYQEVAPIKPCPFKNCQTHVVGSLSSNEEK